MQYKESYVGNGKVILLSGGGKIFTDLAARFVKSERDIDEIADSPYTAEIVHRIIKSGHLAATEFDYFVFAVQGFSRVTEVQLVRKRMASYLIKSGRIELGDKRAFSVVYPKSFANAVFDVTVNGQSVKLSASSLMLLLKSAYESGMGQGISEEDIRYLKPQATEFRGLIGMNAHSLIDWFGWRCCLNAQTEIRSLANKMLKLCREVAFDLFKEAGPRCVSLGYCPEDDYQNPACQRANLYLPKKVAIDYLKRIKQK